jgi:membrane associated rhomboid family serine protease
LKKEAQKFIEAIQFPIIFVILMWVVHLFKVAFQLSLGGYGVYPRAVDGLKGILLSPLIHGDFHHLISNTVPIFALSVMIFLFYRKIAFQSFILIYLLTGLAVWLFARPVYHIGASGVVYGLVSFVFWNGIFRRNVKSIALALIVTTLYSGYFLGILPNQPGISWESHLFGGIVGILVSFLFKSSIEKDEEVKENPWLSEASEQPRNYLDPEVFEKTRQEKLRKQEEQDRDWFSTRTWE